MKNMTFCEKVLKQLPRASYGEREAIRTELENHLADHRDALTGKGMDPEEAMQRAEEAMGDPTEIGKALNAQLSPFWLWVKRVAQGVVYTILIIAACYWFCSSGKLVTGPWDVLAGAWENWQVRQGDAWDPVLKDYPVEWNVDYSWNCWEVMRVEDKLVCLTRVDLEPHYHGSSKNYAGNFYFCIYNQDIFAPAEGEVLTLLSVVPENGIVEEEWPWGWGWRDYGTSSNGVQRRYYRGLVQEGDTYVDVTYNRYGTQVTMRCPLLWKEVER